MDQFYSIDFSVDFQATNKIPNEFEQIFSGY